MREGASLHCPTLQLRSRTPNGSGETVRERLRTHHAIRERHHIAQAAAVRGGVDGLSKPVQLARAQTFNVHTLQHQRPCEFVVQNGL